MSEIQNYYHLSKLKAVVLFYPALEFSNIKSHHQNLLKFLFEFRRKKSSKTEAENTTSFSEVCHFQIGRLAKVVAKW